MDRSKELEECRAWIMAFPKWRMIVGATLVAGFFVFSLAIGIATEPPEGAPLKVLLWRWAITKIAVGFVIGYYLWTCVLRWLRWSRLEPLRAATTTVLIDSRPGWTGNAWAEIGSELVYRAAHKDRVARAYLFDEPYQNLQSPAQATERLGWGRKSLKVYSAFTGLSSATARPGPGWTVHRIAPLILICGAAIKDCKFIFKDVWPEGLVMAASIVGTLVILLIPSRMVREPAPRAEGLAGVATRQLIFAAVNGDRLLRIAARDALLGRCGEDDDAARSACLRLGVLTPDPKNADDVIVAFQ